jgi:cytochrome b561
MSGGSLYDAPTRLIHLLLAVFGIAALVSGQFAGDYRRALHPGYDLHRFIGLGMALALFLRIVWGLAGPRAMRLVTWVPLTRTRLRLVAEDLACLARLRLPVREEHQGLAALIQAIGLAAFVWMALSGALLFVFLAPGARATGWLNGVKELHEAGQPVAIAYVVTHVGAVLAHALAGQPIWRRMLPWGAR